MRILHDRLGFYDGFFLYTALLDQFDKVPGYKLSVSLLMFVLLIQSLLAILKTIKDGEVARLKNIFLAALFIPIFFRAEKGSNVNVAATDTAIYILSVLVFGYFLNFLYCLKEKRELSKDLFMITVLSGAGMVIKGSFFIVGVGY